MAPALPSSLSPHVCILSTPDVEELFEASSLPSLPQTLQCFVPLSQVMTRTTSLVSVPHSSFGLRFSDLSEVEEATHEDEEQRAARTMDWIGARISHRAGPWVKTVEANLTAGADGTGKQSSWKDKTPWWEEVKRCVEGDHIPNSDEGWNHPVAIIFAVSTRAANPLQALQDLNSRALDFPPWVDTTHLRYYLIIHPSNSSLSDPIAEALFNAIKKQYGLHSYLLPLVLPIDPLPAPVPVPSLPPHLPPPPQPSAAWDTPPLAPRPTPAGLVAPDTPRPAMSPIPRSPGPPALRAGQQQSAAMQDSPVGRTIRLSEGDIQQIGKFVREFVVMSLIPWMEKCVIDWNENYSSSRRLPSRLFSSTRRLFGSSAASSATAVHGTNASVSSMSSRLASHGPKDSVSSLTSVTSLGTAVGAVVTQQRRLAEFATMLGDVKLAVSVWENLRKEGRGGSDILPLLLAPSPALALHAAHALSTLQPHSQTLQFPTQSPAHAQIRALSYAVRWAVGIDRKDFLGPVLEGERWLVQAAGSAEDPPSTVLLAHAALLSERKGAFRRSALWYLLAADRFEKVGLKPLALYFFRKAHDLYLKRPKKEVSPSFWDSEDVDPAQWRGFEAVLPGIEHELGRLLYTTGDTEGAVRYFLGLLRGSSCDHSLQADPTSSRASSGRSTPDGRISTDKVYLEDFRVALKHFKTTEREKWEAAGLQLPVTLCQAKRTRVRFTGDTVEGDPAEWDRLEEDWSAFWRPRGKERLERSRKAAVNEDFWVDLVMTNPLDVDINISGLSITVREASSDNPESAKELVEVEVIDGITLGGKETRTIPIAVKCKQCASLVIDHVTYDFLSLLPVTESLAMRGFRLHDTSQQRQNKVYAPDAVIKIDVEEALQRLHTSFVDDEHLVLAQGEYKRLNLWITNSGTNPIGELWMVAGREDELWLDVDKPNSPEPSSEGSSVAELIHSSNSLSPRIPHLISLSRTHGSSELKPEESLQFPVILHASDICDRDLCILFVFREANASSFRCTRVIRHYEVAPLIQIAVSAEASQSTGHLFTVNVEVENAAEGSVVTLKQLIAMSPMWTCAPLGSYQASIMPPYQVVRFSLGAVPWQQRSDPVDTVRFVTNKLRGVLHGDQPDLTRPPPIDLICRHVFDDSNSNPLLTADMRTFIHCNRRTYSTRSAVSSHPYIPPDSHPAIFPLYNPHSLDILLCWELPAEGRRGHVLIPGLTLGAGHAFLKDIVNEAERMKVKRSMYAETQRERLEILGAIRESEWNVEMDPITVTIDASSTVRHDFSRGPCCVHISFMLRNCSPTNPSRVVLKLNAEDGRGSHTTQLASAHFAGRLIHRKVLEPLGSVTFRGTVWVTRPGNVILDGWVVETEIGEQSFVESESAAVPWKSRQLRYVQAPRADDPHYVTVIDDAAS
ncbi:uncharacterized protein LAESUDRAFT_726547 [Laetiporus sulphureus 93-53]|uniref:TPPC8 first Ig-like domain-containing protein n=1 Tax=Laetiporus sulphureus 93-53 TaxID=1314785 RepID=A0A165DZW7_9APHY|nr:uncharacterized protein LAESUDRAFT_726547 [Laetiporus sulphureus 93-53]KZT05978.1 hypothetical protein LAESUDRAFT_726547 [Laetiporus sulphureus 93-53]